MAVCWLVRVKGGFSPCMTIHHSGTAGAKAIIAVGSSQSGSGPAVRAVADRQFPELSLCRSSVFGFVPPSGSATAYCHPVAFSPAYRRYDKLLRPLRPGGLRRAVAPFIAPPLIALAGQKIKRNRRDQREARRAEAGRARRRCSVLLVDPIGSLAALRFEGTRRCSRPFSSRRP
mgnify:CR=1 FL=1